MPVPHRTVRACETAILVVFTGVYQEKMSIMWENNSSQLCWQVDIASTLLLS